MLAATKTMAIKIVNPGGINAFKFNQRKLDLDEKNERYELTPRFEPPQLLRDMVARGDLGKKSGRGFYDWS